MMGDTLFARLMIGRLAFFACALLLLLINIVPLSFEPGFSSRPDLLLCVVITFALRRPEFVPFWLVAGVMFISDVLTMQPPGLWTAIVVLTVEVIRTQEHRFREQVFPLEWVFVAAIIFLALLVNRMTLGLAMVPLPGFSAMMMHFLMTTLAYPLVVFLCYFLLRIHKVSPDEAVLFGHKL